MTYKQSRDWIIDNMSYRKSIRVAGIHPAHHYSNGFVDCYLYDNIEQIAISTENNALTGTLWGSDINALFADVQQKLAKRMTDVLSTYDNIKITYENLVNTKKLLENIVK